MNSLKGVITALATPFSDGELDVASFKNLLRAQMKAGVKSFVVNGTTAESPSLEAEEVKRLLDVAQSEAGDDGAIIVGTGTNCTRTTIEASKRAESWGADALLVVVPYYNKPPQEGLYQHFKAVAESTKLPVLLYNVPGRTVVSLSPETVMRLSKVENIVGIKEATGDLGLFDEMKALVDSEFIFLSGDDDTWGEMTERGGDGVISVISHVIPEQMVRMLKDRNGLAEFKKTYEKLLTAIYSEPNPIGVKMALHQMGLFDSPELRLPLVTMNGAHTDQVMDELKLLEIVK